MALDVGLRGSLVFGARGLQEAGDRRHDFPAINRIPARLLQQADHRLQLVEAREDQLGDVAVDDQLVVAHGVENVLDLMDQVVDVRQSEHRRQALEGVGGAEHLVQQFPIAALLMVLGERGDPLVQPQQVAIELRENLVRLVEEVAEEVVHQAVLGFLPCVAHVGSVRRGGRWQSQDRSRV